MGVGAGSLKILTGVLVHRVARPLRGSVSCGSGWSVPCVSIQLTLSQTIGMMLARETQTREKQGFVARKSLVQYPIGPLTMVLCVRLRPAVATQSAQIFPDPARSRWFSLDPGNPERRRGGSSETSLDPIESGSDLAPL